MSVPLRAKRAFQYASRRLSVGDLFEAHTSSDARILKAIGHAEDRPAAPPHPAAPQTYRARMMTAEPPATVTVPTPAVVTKTDALDDMDVDALHELAKSRGVYVHARAGAQKVRQALREAQQRSVAE